MNYRNPMSRCHSSLKSPLLDSIEITSSRTWSLFSTDHWREQCFGPTKAVTERFALGALRFNGSDTLCTLEAYLSILVTTFFLLKVAGLLVQCRKVASRHVVLRVTSNNWGPREIRVSYWWFKEKRRLEHARLRLYSCSVLIVRCFRRTAALYIYKGARAQHATEFRRLLWLVKAEGGQSRKPWSSLQVLTKSCGWGKTFAGGECWLVNKG